MKLSDIQKELARMFDGMPAEPGGAVIVWHDPEGSFESTLDDLELPGVEIMREEKNRLFELKCALNEDLSGRRILLYRKHLRHLDGDWLADVEARSEQFAADFASMQLRELNAADTPEMRSAVSEHKRFLFKKTNMKRMRSLCDAYTAPHQLELSIMAILLDADSAHPVSVARAFLEACCRDGSQEVLTALDGAGCRSFLASAMTAWTGYDRELSDTDCLIDHILTSACAATAPETVVRALPSCHSIEKGEFCASVVSEWARSGNREELLDACCDAEARLDIAGRIADADPADLAQCSVFPCIDATIQRKLCASLSDSPADAESALQIVEGRRGSLWYPRLEDGYRCLSAAARMQRFHLEHAQGISHGKASEIWKRYTAELFQMDTLYRELHLYLSKVIQTGSYDLDEEFRAMAGALENLYKGWFLKALSRRWIEAAQGDLGELGYVSDVPRQTDFFMAEVEPTVRSRKRVCVIVSDALRYEVAVELAGELERTTKGSCELGSMQAVFPTVTKGGMAALLPAATYWIAEKSAGGIAVEVNGEEVPDCRTRQLALRAFDPAAVAVPYDTFLNEMDKLQRRALTADAKVVFIYHNTIDALGDKPATERKVFSACRDAVEEIAALVAQVVREKIASSVIVTADHGFLYTDEPLGEAEHASVADIAGEVVESGRRYAVARAGSSSEALLAVAMPASRAHGNENGLIGFSPRECVRIRQSGGGENYVHGGISLQEMCIPVLRFTNKRAGTKGYTESQPSPISLVTAIDTISNSIFTLELLQEEPVGGKVLAAEYDLFVGDDARRPITDPVKVVADRTDAEAERRIIATRLSLTPGASTSESEMYHLFIRNRKTGATDSLRDLHVRIAFAPSIDFGW